MNREDEIKRVFYAYEEAGLIDGDYAKVLSLVSDDVIGIGIGEQGFVTSKKEIEKIMTTTVKNDLTATYALDYEHIVIRFPSDTCANLCAQVTVRCTAEGMTTTSGFMQSLTLTLNDGAWLIRQLHASPIMLSEESIEAYPLSFADHTLANLRAELQVDTFDLINESFSAGVFGTYITEHFPLYFVNDTLIGQMGYTREEFNDLFEGDARNIIFEEDQDRVMSEVADAIEQGRDEFELHYRAKTKAGGYFWVIEHARRTADSSGVPVLLGVTTDVTELVALQNKLEEQNKTILSSLQYASKIQRDQLPASPCFAEAFADSAVLWKPRDIVGGDIYWLKRFDAGAVLAVCDCTGHGTPGALLTMLVSSALDSIVNEYNCQDTAQIMIELDQKISAVLNVHTPSLESGGDLTQIHDGCDVAILFIANDGSVALSSAGVPVFVCDGSQVNRIRGQRLHIGDGLLSDRGEVMVTSIPPSATNKFYIASDGLFDQIGGEQSSPFGYRTVQELVLLHHGETQENIASKLWEAFESYRGEYLRRDDIELIAFQPHIF